jgi:hypothetical protein
LELLTVIRTYLFCFITILYCISATRQEVEGSFLYLATDVWEFIELYTLVAKVLKKRLMFTASPKNQYPLARG